MSAESGKADMTPGAISKDADLSVALFDLVGDGFGAALILYDKNDLIVYAGKHVVDFYPIGPNMLAPGTRLRDFLGAIFDSGLRNPSHGNGFGNQHRDDWLSERIASHWRERSEAVERYGYDRWVRLLRRRMPNGYGMCLMTDISEDKKRESQWRADMERVQLTEDILDNVPFPLFVKDHNLVYVAVNLAFCEKFQVSADEVLGRVSRDLFSPEVARLFEESDRHVLETGNISVSRQRQIALDGSELSVVSRKQRIGKPGRYFLVSTMQELPHDGWDLDEFQLPEDPAKDGSSFHQVYLPGGAHGNDGLRAMETILPETFAGRRVLLVTTDDELERSALQTLQKCGFEACTVRCAEELGLFLDTAADADFRIDLVLIDNQLDLRCVEVAENHCVAALIVDAFQVAHELTFRIAHHFNRNEVTSQPRRKRSENDWEILTEEEPAAPLDVLVVEDNAINQIVFSQILEVLGYRYIVAVTGEDAVSLWSEHKPRIVLMDISLPGMNGFEASRQIRALEKDADISTPIIGVLTQAYERDRKECAAAGMNDVIMKPVSPEMLESLFQRYIDQPAKRALA